MVGTFFIFFTCLASQAEAEEAKGKWNTFKVNILAKENIAISCYGFCGN